MFLYGLVVFISNSVNFTRTEYSIYFLTPEERTKFLAETHLMFDQYQFTNVRFNLETEQPKHESKSGQ